MTATTPLEREVLAITHKWRLRGGKTARGRDQKKMLAFARAAGADGARSLGQVGAAHVIRYWRFCRERGMSDAVMMQHFYALRHLWALAGEPGEPPRPRLEKTQDCSKSVWP